MTKRFCLDCTSLVEAPASRCGTHQREWEAKRELKNPGRARYRDPAYKNLPRPNNMLCCLRLSVCTYIATTWDHIIPVSKGGTNDLSNLRPSCKPCNSARR